MKKYICLLFLFLILFVFSCENTYYDNNIPPDYIIDTPATQNVKTNIPDPTAQSEEFLFSHQIFASQTELYFYQLSNGFKVYSTEDHGITLDEIKIDFPEDLSFDKALPVTVRHGAGSGECEFIVEVIKDGVTSYHSFNNFRYTDASNWLDFEYGGEIENTPSK